MVKKTKRSNVWPLIVSALTLLFWGAAVVGSGVGAFAICQGFLWGTKMGAGNDIMLGQLQILFGIGIALVPYYLYRLVSEFVS